MTNQGETSFFEMHACDPQEQAASFGMLDQSYEQISAGAFSGSLHALSGGDVTVFHETLNQGVFQMGVSDPAHFTIAVAYALSDRLYWNGGLLDQGSVVAYAPGRDFELRTPRRTACVGVSLAPSALQSLVPGQPPEHWQKLFTRIDCWSPDTQRPFALQARIAGVLRSAGQAAASHAPGDFTLDLIGLRELTIDCLGSVVEQQQPWGHRLRAASYPRIARRARALMLERLGEPLTVTDICLGLGCSRRSLQYACESVFDLSPMAYLRNLRLAAARQQLRCAGPGTTVKGVAAAVGFSHLPRFAQAYSQMYGEWPSQSLATGR